MVADIKSPGRKSEFPGPAEFADAWDQFIRAYTKNGTAEHCVDNPPLLSKLVFDGGAAAFVKIHGESPRRFSNARFGLEHIAEAMSDATADTAVRPLHRYIVARLMMQWIDLEERHGLYPPPPASYREKASRAEQAAIRQRQANLLRMPEGALLAGVLRMLVSAIIRAEAASVYERSRGKMEYGDVVAEATKRFYASLFNFEADRGTTFTSFVQSGLRLALPSRVLLVLKQRRTSLDSIAGDSLDDRVGDLVADHRAILPIERLINSERSDRVRKILGDLTPRERDVLTLRFGLNDGQHRTFEEVGSELHITTSWAQKIHADAIIKCHRLLERDGSKPVGADPPPRGRR